MDVIPVKYATLSELTSNLSRCIGFAMMPSRTVRTRDVRDTVVGVGCRKPLIKWPTNAKWKLLLNDKPTAWSNCLKCHSSASRVLIMTSLMLFLSKTPCELSVCKFCSSNANPAAYKVTSSSCRTDIATQNSARCIDDS